MEEGWRESLPWLFLSDSAEKILMSIRWRTYQEQGGETMREEAEQDRSFNSLGGMSIEKLMMRGTGQAEMAWLGDERGCRLLSSPSIAVFSQLHLPITHTTHSRKITSTTQVKVHCDYFELITPLAKTGNNTRPYFNLKVQQQTQSGKSWAHRLCGHIWANLPFWVIQGPQHKVHKGWVKWNIVHRV